MTIVAYTAQDSIDPAPPGAIILFSDGTPQPSSGLKHKRSAWETRNGARRGELQHVAQSKAAAWTWFEAHRHSNVRLEFVADPARLAAAA